MKIKHGDIIIEMDDEERQMLKVMMAIIEEISNDAGRNEKLSPAMVSAGLDSLREAGEMREAASALRKEL